MGTTLSAEMTALRAAYTRACVDALARYRPGERAPEWRAACELGREAWLELIKAKSTTMPHRPTRFAK